MTKITTLAEAETALQPYIPLVGKLTGEDSTLDRNRALMAALGNPERKTRAVHIAGTSGKTSTAYYVAALLRQAGKKVGLTVSPHIDSVAERVQINGVPLAVAVFCAYLGEFLEIVEAGGFAPSYFELLVAFSFWVFDREKVDYMVLETGLGGRYDATNLADRSDKLCVITDIGYDHMNVLGNTIEEIAYQKAGIIHAKNPVIVYEQSAEIQQVFVKQAEDVHAELLPTTQAEEAKRYGRVFPASMPEFQQRNWLLAHAAYQFLRQRDDLAELSDEQKQTTQLLQVPGRMDRFAANGKTIIMDGAHNGQKIAMFLRSFQLTFPHVKPVVLIALKQGKEPSDVAPLLAPLAAKIIVTTFETSQDLPAKSIDPTELAEIFLQAGASEVLVEPDHMLAYQMLLESTTDVGIVTGSFYLLSQLRDKLPRLQK